MTKRGRPKTEWTPILIRFRPDVLTIMDVYCDENPDMTHVEAVHNLIKKGWQAHLKESQHASQDPGTGPSP